MRHLADFFRQNGFRVMAVLLPGHGTQPGDLLDVTWQEWARPSAPPLSSEPVSFRYSGPQS
jgi:esterase/lipase